MSTRSVRLPLFKDSSTPLVPFVLPGAEQVSEALPAFDRESIRSDTSRSPRTSSYTIYVDLPGEAEQMLLVHGYTGAYDKVSRRVATYLRSLEPVHAPKPLYGDWTPEPRVDGPVTPPTDETMERLRKRGYLTTLTQGEEESFFLRMMGKRHFGSIHRPPNFIVMPTYQCNLRCPYCFQDHMRTDPSFSHLLRVMDDAMVERLHKGMLAIEAAHGILPGSPHHRTITLFGGEPLLAETRPAIDRLFERCADRKTEVSAVTNGTDLEVFRDLLGAERISFLQITLDGPPNEHDERRVYADGSGSFERIAKNLTMALELGVRVSVRMNVDRRNLAQLPDVVARFRAEGWQEHGNFSAYVAPVHAHAKADEASTFRSSWELNRAMEKIRAERPELADIQMADDSLLHQARQVFAKGADPSKQFRSAFCGAHTTMYVLDAFADIYACWERTGEPDVRIGMITESGEVQMHPALLESWRGRHVASNPTCRKCRYATVCGGGCAALAEDHAGTMYTNFCDGFAKRFRASVASAYLDHLAGATHREGVELLCDV